MLRLVCGEALYLTAAGAAAGVCAALLLARLAGAFVHGLPPIDATSLALVLIALTLVVFTAAALPARRARQISPTIALKR